MVYTIINSDGRSFDLPKKTVNIMEALDRAVTIDSNKKMSLREKYNYLHGFVKELLGDANARECLGSDNLDEIDLSELAIAVRKIYDSYEKPIEDYNASKARQKLSGLQLDKIAPMLSAAEKVSEFKK